ncbi:hypothetical protein I5239_10405, partial [Neisseria gonorrhoeae]|nr:hypothetical protein [Neisseria gonorrhoeae]
EGRQCRLKAKHRSDGIVGFEVSRRATVFKPYAGTRTAPDSVREAGLNH